MKRALGPLIIVIALLLIPILRSCLYIVNETEHVIVTQFGEVIGDPISTPGLKFKTPVQTVNRLEKRLLNWDGQPIEIPTKDKAYISLSTFARWRITDPKLFFIRLRDARSAESRLEDILGSETRNAIARNELIEIVRTDKTRVPEIDETIQAAVKASEQSSGTKIGTLPKIRVGREAIEAQMKKGAEPKLREYGIELLDVRFKRINYNEDVLARVYQRMISERLQIAERFRSEGEAEAARITGNRERELNTIESQAYKTVQELRGSADAEASRIYAETYTQHEAAPDFFRFLKTLDTLRSTIQSDTSLMLSTDSELLQFLSVNPTPKLPLPAVTPTPKPTKPVAAPQPSPKPTTPPATPPAAPPAPKPPPAPSTPPAPAEQEATPPQ